ncbi:MULTISPECIES: MarR family transcriptional regulator [unclassified Alteromonas]|jgi:DNA-binding transcriptional ArsR family regulator|uniref:MarR family transcriptional regulator n=1 Tax=unclassified Alteromonas TaxID=2614992 RepID=UPI000B631C29|nr:MULTISPECIES: helix-turn-helix domain-containing protein [unclassified Alteromonas]MCG7649681.1 winged helix-turn-helix domain-containing protein [Alteromonas sp. MmMcT2-5]NQY16237.1 MarR family transcriptional regulator [Alteromonas sp.]OUX88838.1 MAG: DNA-binding protein [Alteromonas sp. TMED35]|tara:strand:- start:3853 stop:4395 length:543 start_codon:yes stop_codon:yes gene_type:complete
MKLIEFTNGSDHPFGNRKGQETYSKLKDYLDQNSIEGVVEISLEGIKATDASFPRESVISIIKHLNGERLFYLTGFNSKDLLDNWDYAAKAKNQLVVTNYDNSLEIIGPDLNTSTRELINYVYSQSSVTTANVAKALGLSVQNASTRLKKLVNEGIVLREEEAALSGGKEFVYKRLFKSV